MKKILTALVVLITAFCLSASATTIVPGWVENMQPGDSYTSGEYQTSMGFAEEGFTPTTFDSMLAFGNYENGGIIYQSLSTDITGMQAGDVGRQVMGQSASAFVATSPAGFFYDPEHPNTAVVAQMGITKNQFAAVSGAIVANPEEDLYLASGPDANGDGFPDDHYTGKHNVQWVEVTDPSYTTTFSDYAMVGTPDVQLNQEVEDAAVTVSAEAHAITYPADLTQLIDPACDGNDPTAVPPIAEIWSGYGIPGATDPYGQQKYIAANGNLFDYVTGATTAQLTEVGTSMSSDVTLTQIANNPLCWDEKSCNFLLDGSASLGGQFQNAQLAPDAKLSIDFNTGTTPFNYWWSETPDMVS